MSNFSSGIPFNFFGYKLLYRPPQRLLRGRNYDSVNEVSQENPNRPYFNDPRGLFVDGMIPSETVSYRIYHEASQPFVSGGKGIADAVLGLASVLGPASGLALKFSMPEFVSVRTLTRSAIVCFEGNDVIDSPATEMERDGESIILPDNVFRAYHAGPEKLVSEGESMAQEVTAAFFSSTEDNLVRGVVPSPGATFDMKEMERTQGKQFVDVLSNKVRLDGDPDFISYTTADKVFFRDVVVMNVGSMGFGTVSALAGFTLAETAAGTTMFHVLRFVPLTSTIDEEVVTRWRLSESYGIEPTGDVQETPEDLRESLGREDHNKDSISRYSKHYVYNLNGEEQEVSETFEMTPLIEGISPALALAKQDANNPYYDDEFSSVVYDYVPGFASTGGLVTTHNVNYSGEMATEPAYSYTSPKLKLRLGRRGRIGFEYVTSKMTTTVGTAVTETIILASTKELVTGLTVAYDDSIHVANVIYPFSVNGGTLVERLVSDASWTTSQDKPRESAMGRFLVGEFPLVSDGYLVFPGNQEEIDTGTSGDEISIPSDTQATALSLISGKDDGTLTLHPDSSGKDDPVFEVALTTGTTLSGEQRVQVGIPPLTFTRVKDGGGLVLDKMYGVKLEEVMLESMPEAEDQNDPSDMQISLIEEIKFPVPSSSPSAISDSSTGWSYMAYEHEDRIDFAFKRSYSEKWTIVRDVTLRIPDDFGEDEFEPSKDKLPPSTSPFLVNDPGSRVIFLFYLYKEKLLVKKIPTEIMFPLGNEEGTSRLSISNEKTLVKNFHSITASLVYDGSGGDGTTSISIDVENGSIKVPADPEVTTLTPEGQEDEEQPGRVVRHSAFMDFSGFLYAFFQVDTKIVARFSYNMGDTWRDALSGSFSLVPQTTEDNEEEESPPEEAPSCLYDRTTKTTLIFFFSGDALLFSKIPEEALRGQVQAEGFASEIETKFIAGSLSQDLVDRGIIPVLGVSNQEEDLQLNPHRVAGYITSEGYYRIFLKDEQDALLSYISFDTGSTWLSEEDFLNQEEE